MKFRKIQITSSKLKVNNKQSFQKYGVRIRLGLAFFVISNNFIF